MTGQGVIDSHHHVWDTTSGDYPWMVGPFAALRGTHDMTELKPVLERNSVTATVLVQARADIHETLTLLTTAAANPEVVGVVGWVDLTSPQVATQIEALKHAEGGEFLVGIRHGVADEPDPQWLQRDDVVRGLAAVRDAGLAFDLELTEREIPAGIATARRFPDLRLIVDHLAKPDIRNGITAAWTAGLAGIATYPNVAAKISGLVTEADWTRWSIDEVQTVVDHALDVFEPERLMFGSDWPVCELAAPYDVVLATARATLLTLSAQQQAQIFSETARTQYRLAQQQTPIQERPNR